MSQIVYRDAAMLFLATAVVVAVIATAIISNKNKELKTWIEYSTQLERLCTAQRSNLPPLFQEQQ